MNCKGEKELQVKKDGEEITVGHENTKGSYEENNSEMNILQKFKYRVSKYGFGYVMGIILQNKIYRPLDNIVMTLGKILFSRFRLRDTIIIESHNDFDMNGGAFYDYLLKNGYTEKYKIVWMLRNSVPKEFPENVIGFNMFKPNLRKSYYLCTAKYMTSDHHIINRERRGQIACYLTHGPVGLKACKGKTVIPENMDCVLTPSEFLSPIMADQLGIPCPNSIQHILGFPMHDVFYNDEEGDLNRITKRKYYKVILWMPTFRKSVDFNRNDSMSDLPLGIPILRSQESCERLNAFLRKENVLLIVKIHPMQDLTTVKIYGLSNIIVLDANSVKKLGVDNYRLMKDVDALISDYSSAAYDFLHADKPIGFTVDDANEYKLGLIFEDPVPYMPGHIIYNQEDFMQFIDDVASGKDKYKDERKKIFDLFFKYHDGNSCQRLVDYLGLKL